MRLSHWLSARFDRIWAALSAQHWRFYHRLARDVPAQCSSRTRRVVHPFACTRVAAIRRSAEGPQTETDRHVTHQLAYRALCRGADDVLQPVQSRYSGPLSDPVSYTHLRAHETCRNLVCRLLL